MALAGLPPFGLFVSELMIFAAAFSAAHHFIAVLMLAAISVVFGALLYHFQRMLAGEAEETGARPRLHAFELATISVCSVCLLVLGLHIPATFAALLRGAQAVIQ